MKTKKESPSGGEKLLRLLASGTTGPNDANKLVIVMSTVSTLCLAFQSIEWSEQQTAFAPSHDAEKCV